MTKAKLRKLLTKPKFRAWLEGRGARKGVGKSGRARCCPLACYLHEQTGAPALVSGWIRIGNTKIGFPAWCDHFVRSTDSAGYNKVITAGSALRILDGIK